MFDDIEGGMATWDDTEYLRHERVRIVLRGSISENQIKEHQVGSDSKTNQNSKKGNKIWRIILAFQKKHAMLGTMGGINAMNNLVTQGMEFVTYTTAQIVIITNILFVECTDNSMTLDKIILGYNLASQKIKCI